MSELRKNYFAELNALNVGDKTEKKNGLTYLSWAWAWAEVKKKYPLSFYTVYEDANNNIYHTDGKTCWVKTGVTVVDDNMSLEHIEYLPVMDFKNKSIPLENITSMDANKAIQRSLTKACARHGIGLYVYAGEDLPEETEDIKILKTRIDTAVKEKTGGMDTAAKVKFAGEYIVPILGQPNYKICNDVAKLSELMDKLSA